MKRIPKPTHGSQEWLQLRHRDDLGRVVFGASDAPALMGASPYKTRADLFINKLEEPKPSPDLPEFRRGNILEPVLLQEAEHYVGLPIVTPQFVYQNDRFSVSLDGVDDPENPSLIVEAKTTTRYSIRESNDLPEEWLWQGWCQQGVLSPNLSKPLPVLFVVLDRDQRFNCVQMPNNPEAYEMLRNEAENFGKWVESGMPAPDEINNFTADQIAKLFKSTPTEVDLDDDGFQLLLDLQDLRAAQKQLEEQEKDIRKKIAQALLNNEIGTFNGKKVVSWKEQRGRKGVDLTLLRNEHPELVAQYEKEGAPFRVLRTHIGKIGE
jgi:predicted phage-related endonuclease